MRARVGAAVLALAALIASPGARAQWAEPPPAAIELSYGAEPRQALDLARPAGTAGKAPLLLFVHGGGWLVGDKRRGAG